MHLSLFIYIHILAYYSPYVTGECDPLYTASKDTANPILCLQHHLKQTHCNFEI